jgi:hypothetical protein
LPRGEELRVELVEYRGQTYVGIRRWYRRPGGPWSPGKGANLRIGFLPWLRAALETAEGRALELGALAEEDFELAGRPIPPEILEGA